MGMSGIQNTVSWEFKSVRRRAGQLEAIKAITEEVHIEIGYFAHPNPSEFKHIISVQSPLFSRRIGLSLTLWGNIDILVPILVVICTRR